MDKEKMLGVMNGRSLFNIHNGIKIVDIGEDFCAVEGELRPETRNPWGMAHGGFVYSLCDVAAGALASKLDLQGVTLSANIQYLRPSVGNKLRAESRLIKAGRTVAFIQTDVYNDENVHTARGEFQIFIKSRNDET